MLINLMSDYLNQMGGNNEEVSKQTKVWSLVAPHSAPVLENRAIVAPIKRLLLLLPPPLSQCGPRIERLCWVFPSASGSGYAVSIGFYRDRCDSPWPQPRPPRCLCWRRAAQGDWIAHVRPPRVASAGNDSSWAFNARRWSGDLLVSEMIYPIYARNMCFFLLPHLSFGSFALKRV